MFIASTNSIARALVLAKAFGPRVPHYSSQIAMYGVNSSGMGGIYATADAMSWIQPSHDLIQAIGNLKEPAFVPTLATSYASATDAGVLKDYEKSSFHYVDGTFNGDVGFVIRPSVEVYHDAKECVDALLMDYLEVLKEAAQIAPYEFDIRFDDDKSQTAIKALNDAVWDLENRTDNSKYAGRIDAIIEFIEYVRCARSVRFTRCVGHKEKESIGNATAENIALAALFPNHALSPSQIEAQFVTGSRNYYAQRMDYQKHHPIKYDRKYMSEDARSTETQSLSYAFRSRTKQFTDKRMPNQIECSMPRLSSKASFKTDLYITKVVEDEAEALKSALCMSWALSRPGIYNAFSNVNSRMQGAGAALGGF